MIELVKPGPKYPASFPRVIFRISKEKEIRVFDPRQFTSTHPSDTLRSTAQNLMDWCNTFMDLRCRPLMISHDCGQTWSIVSKEVDFFYCEHPLVNK